VIPDHSDHVTSNEPINPLSKKNLSVHLIYHVPSDLASPILMRIIPKKVQSILLFMCMGHLCDQSYSSIRTELGNLCDL